MYGRLIQAWGADPETFNEDHRRSSARPGPMEPHLRSIAAELRLSGDLAEVMQVRRDWTFEALVPRPEALPTSRLSDGGHKLGMISACSQDVPDVWDQTPLGGLFDATIFSCSVGFSKPDRRIYELAADERRGRDLGLSLRRRRRDDELPGAEQAGMTALATRPGEQLTADGERWTGRCVSLLSDVLELT